MPYSSVFYSSLICFGIVSGLLAFCVILFFKAKNITYIEKIPRNVILGTVFAIIDVFWCIPQAVAVFSSGSEVWIYPLGIAFLLIGCFFLDYLFARALAGFLILLCHYFLLESFAAGYSYMWLFSVFFYIMGTFGILIGGFPHILRDIIRKISQKPNWRLTAIFITTLYSILGLVSGILGFIK